MINISSLSYYLPWRSSQVYHFHPKVIWEGHLFHLVIDVGNVILEVDLPEEGCVLLEGEVTECFLIKGIKLKLHLTFTAM